MSLAERVETEFAPDGVVADPRGVSLFRLTRRVVAGDRFAAWQARVVDETLRNQGAPEEVLLYGIEFPAGLAPERLSTVLSASGLEHPRLLLSHSVALPSALAARLRPTPGAPPVNTLPLCDQAECALVVKEAFDGTPLSTVFAEAIPPPTPAQAVALVEDLAEALSAFHANGRAHGAIAAETVLLDPRSWRGRLLDAGELRLTFEAGKPAGAASIWCAPEAFTGEADARGDQFALGALLHAMWTGRPAFSAPPHASQPDHAARRRRTEVDTALALVPGSAITALPTPMQGVFARALAIEPGQRFPSLEAFVAAARSAARSAGTASHADITQKMRVPVAASPPAPMQDPTPEVSPEAITEPPPTRPITQIIQAPKYRPEEYPEHPDVESRIRKAVVPLDDEEQRTFHAAFAEGRWAFNRLSAVLLVLWLVTLGWGLYAAGHLDPLLETEARPAASSQAGALEERP